MLCVSQPTAGGKVEVNCSTSGPHSRALSFTLTVFLFIYHCQPACQHVGAYCREGECRLARPATVGDRGSRKAENQEAVLRFIKRANSSWKRVESQLRVDECFCCSLIMVKCLIRIKTKVNVHLRMINHCYRDVKVRVLSLGPRLLGKALGVLPLLPALPGGSSASGSGPGLRKESRTPSRLSVPPQLHGYSPAGSRAGKNQGWFW